MTTELRVLFIEDDAGDAALLLLELERGGYVVVHDRVQTAADLRVALERQPWDLILADYAMPAFDAPCALEIAQEKGVDCPFIIVSGAVDEEDAVTVMRSGAHDFIPKHKLARLLPAIARELQEAAGRRERARMSEQLVLADRMASLGTLAASVMHEINNPLSSLLGNLDVTAETLHDAITHLEDPVYADPMQARDVAARVLRSARASLAMVEDSREAAARIRAITADLKSFVWRDESRVPTDVVRAMESSLRLARTEIRPRAQVVRSYEAVPPVLATETRLGQVFLNLLINAAQAIPEGDACHQEIRVSTRVARDGRVVTEVRDTGPGISPSTLPLIFDPFFTTKARGVGSGLGLPICRRVVTELGGEIVVATGARGTTFEVWLPPATGREVARAERA